MRSGGVFSRLHGKPVTFSYWLILTALVLAGWLHLAGAFVATLFAYFALSKLHIQTRGGRAIALVFFLILLSGIGYGLGFLINRAVSDLPEIAEQAIPSVIDYARQHHITLPFTDYDSLKELAIKEVKNQVHYLGTVARVARGAASEIVLIIIGVVIAAGLFFNPAFEITRGPPPMKNNLYSLCAAAISARFQIFYESFATVMGAQIAISAINTVLTASFVFSVHLPHAFLVIGATFVCGLIPIIGNLISNTIMVGIGITQSPTMAVVTLIFLVVIHKLEYFLNSKIVGDRIKTPFWLTLLGLILGEKLMGIPGMILAPVILHYLKLETSKIEVRTQPEPELVGAMD
jgi:predicted PurR-regulated permease PerM